MLAMTKDMTVMAVVTMGQSFDGPSDDDAKELKVMTKLARRSPLYRSPLPLPRLLSHRLSEDNCTPDRTLPKSPLS